MSRDPAAELDAAADWLHLADRYAARLTGRPTETLAPASVRADLRSIAGWMRRHPYLAADVADHMPAQEETP